MWSHSDLIVISQWSHCDLTVISLWSHSDLILISQWSHSWSRVYLFLSQCHSFSNSCGYSTYTCKRGSLDADENVFRFPAACHNDRRDLHFCVIKFYLLVVRIRPLSCWEFVTSLDGTKKNWINWKWTWLNCHPSCRETLTQCWFTVGPASLTLTQQ